MRMRFREAGERVFEEVEVGMDVHCESMAFKVVCVLCGGDIGSKCIV